MGVSEYRAIRNRRHRANRRNGDRRQGPDRRVVPDPHDQLVELPDTSAYVTNRGLVMGTIAVRSSADQVAITRDGAYAYVKHAEDGSVSILRTLDHTTVITIARDGSLVDPGARPQPEPEPEPASLDLDVGPLPAEVAHVPVAPPPPPPPPAQTQVHEIGTKVRDLVTAGVLRSAWADVFLRKLDATTEQMRNGRPTPLRELLQAFAHQVLHFQSAGILSTAQGQALRVSVEGAIREIAA